MPLTASGPLPSVGSVGKLKEFIFTLIFNLSCFIHCHLVNNYLILNDCLPELINSTELFVALSHLDHDGLWFVLSGATTWLHPEL